MNDFLVHLGSDLNLAYHKSYNAIYGRYRGYRVYINECSGENKFIIKFPFLVGGFYSERTYENIGSPLKANNPELKEFQFKNDTLTINLNRYTDNIDNIINLVKVINHVTQLAKENSVISCCEICKGDISTDIYKINNSLFILCNTCNINLQNEIKEATEKEHRRYEKSEKNEKKSNVIVRVVNALRG